MHANNYVHMYSYMLYIGKNMLYIAMCGTYIHNIICMHIIHSNVHV